MYTVEAAASELGLSSNQVRYLLAKKELKGFKRGRYWIVEELNYKRKRRHKIKGSRSKISSKQLELLEVLNEGWILRNRDLNEHHVSGEVTYKKHHWFGEVTNHPVGMVAIKSPMGKIMLINLKRMAKAKEVDQAIKKRLPHYIELSYGCEKYIPYLVKLVDSCGSCLPYPTQEIPQKLFGYPRIVKCLDLYIARPPDNSPIERGFRNVTVYHLENEGLVREDSEGNWTLTKKGKQALKEQL